MGPDPCREKEHKIHPDVILLSKTTFDFAHTIGVCDEVYTKDKNKNTFYMTIAPTEKMVFIRFFPFLV